MVTAGEAAARIVSVQQQEDVLALMGRGLGCHVKFGVLYIGVQAFFPRLDTGLGG